MKEREKLAIDQGGNLVATGRKELSVNDSKELIEVNYVPAIGQIILQLLPEKDIETASGLVLPASKKELKAVVVTTQKVSTYTRGEVIKLDGNPFIRVNQSNGQMDLNIPVDYIDGKACLQVPEHFILGTYTNINLSNWKAE